MHSRRDELLAVLVILPSIVLLAIFVYAFIGQSIKASVTDWGQQAALSLNPEIHYVGMQNYKDLFTGFLGMRFRQDLTSMIFFTALFVVVALAVGLGLATLIDRAGNGREIRVDRSELKTRILAAQQKNPEQPVLIAGDKNVKYEAVLSVMDELQRAQVKKIGLLVQTTGK